MAAARAARRGGPPGGGQGAGSAGCPKGETRLTATSAKASADASGGGSAATGPGSAASASDTNGTGGANGAQQAPAGGGEGGQGPGQGGQGQGGRMQAMLTQLDLDPQQQLKAQALFTAARGEAMSNAAGAGDDPDAQRSARKAAYDKAFGQLDAILRPDQKAKLAQLRAQMAQRRGGSGGGQ